MSDARYDTYQHYGTNAERLAFVPSPPTLTGVQPVYLWYETDTGSLYLYFTSWVLISGTGSGVILKTRVSFTNADILALPTTPIEIIPTPGAGNKIVFFGSDTLLDNSAGAYGNVDNLCWASYQINGFDVSDYIADQFAAVNAISSVFDNANDYHLGFNRLNQPDIVTGWFAGALRYNGGSAMTNQPLMFQVTNAAAGNFTGGNAANTWNHNVFYAIVEV